MQTDEARDHVRRAYEWVLGRAPDPHGWDFYADLLVRGELDLAGLRQGLMRSPEFLGQHNLTVVEHQGLKLIIDPTEADFGRRIAASGDWEPVIGGLIETHMPPDGVFLDVGANVGVMSFRAARRAGPDGRVFAFEPNPKNADQLLRGAIANGLDNITLFPMAASDRRQTVFTLKTSNAKVVARTDVLQMENATQAVRVDDVLGGLDRLDMVKLDIEGHEVQALRGMTGLLARFRPKVVCEFNPLCLRPHGGVEPEVLADLVFSMTDKVTVIHGDEVLGDVDDAAALMALWRDRDRAITATGHLPAGWTHFDLFFQVSRSPAPE